MLTVLTAILLCSLLPGCNSEESTSTTIAGDDASTGAVSMAATARADRQPDAAPRLVDQTMADPCDDARNPDFDPDTCGDPDASVAAYTGKWRITGIETGDGKVQAFTRDDPAIMGSEFAISRARIQLTKKASDRFNTDVVCDLPSAAPVGAIVQKEEGAGLANAAKARNLKGAMHRFGCINGGDWGPANTSSGMSLFIPAAKDVMIMQWYDGTYLIAEQI